MIELGAVTSKNLGTCRSSLRGIFITAENGDHAEREQAALSSLPVRTRWKSDCLTSESYSLGVACPERARMCVPLATGGGDSVLRGLVTRVALVMNKCVRARCVVESYRQWYEHKAHIDSMLPHTTRPSVSVGVV